MISNDNKSSLIQILKWFTSVWIAVLWKVLLCDVYNIGTYSKITNIHITHNIIYLVFQLYGNDELTI